MCGRYNLDVPDPMVLIKRFRVEPKGTMTTYTEMKSSWNIAPSQVEPVVVTHSPNSIEMMLWGLIPFWEKTSVKPKGLINVRDDTAINKKWAHKYLQFQRCLIPASGFYEWQRAGKEKIPHHIRLKSKDYMGFAGIYSEWKHPTNETTLHTYSIITTSANKLMAPIHHRMPVILPQEDEDKWLNPDMVELEHIKDFLKPYPDEDMEAYPISTRVNSPMQNTADLINPA